MRPQSTLEVTTAMHRDFAQLSSLRSIDADYRFGRPKVYLAPHELARLAILRSKLGDTQAERLAQAAGLVRSRRGRGRN